MSFLHKAISTATFRRIWREVFDYLQDLLWNEILVKERFTTLGAAQFSRDVTAILAIIDEYIPGGSHSTLGLPRLQAGVTLLNLPTTAEEGQISLRDAYGRVFSDNTEAKKVIDELDLFNITYSDARTVLQRRVEADE